MFRLLLIAALFFVVFLGCFGIENVTKDDVSDVADCYYEGTIVVDDRYGIVLDKDCMDVLLLSAAPKIAIETEAIANAEEVLASNVESPELDEEATETEAAQQYPCPIEDRGDWTLLVTLKRNNFNLPAFRVPKEWIDLITKAYVDGKDFLFIIYEPAIPVQPTSWNNATRSYGGILQARYYLEAPGLLHNNPYGVIGRGKSFIEECFSSTDLCEPVIGAF